MILKISKLNCKFNCSTYVCKFSWQLKANKHKNLWLHLWVISNAPQIWTLSSFYGHRRRVEWPWLLTVVEDATLYASCPWKSGHHRIPFSTTSAGQVHFPILFTQKFINSFILLFLDSQVVPDKTTSKELSRFSIYLRKRVPINHIIWLSHKGLESNSSSI